LALLQVQKDVTPVKFVPLASIDLIKTRGVAGGISATVTAIDCTSFLPVGVKAIWGIMELYSAAGGAGYGILSPTADLTGEIMLYRVMAAGEYIMVPFFLPIVEGLSTAVYYQTVAIDEMRAYLTGYWI
jgi:hypothetical protein